MIPTNIDSILYTKASGSIETDIIHDLLQLPGKSIAELIYDQKTKIDQTETTQTAQERTTE